MTDIYRLFDVESRALKCIKGRQYAGQSFDSYSTTLHIVYSDSTFLEADSDGSAYVPYIIFDKLTEDGVPYAYGPSSTPVFDGYTFDIPWDVTAGASGRLQYQLCFTLTEWELDDRGVAIVVRDATNLLSAKDGIVLKPSIRAGCAPPDRMPLAPYIDPSVTAMVSMLLERALVVPVSVEIGDDNRIHLLFNTYRGDGDVDVCLDVPYLTSDGTVSPEFLAFIDTWDEAASDNLASALMTSEALALKVDAECIVTEWSDETSDGRIPSESLVKASLDKKVDADTLVTEWSDPLSDGNIPSEKLVKDTIDSLESAVSSDISDLLDSKTDVVQAVPVWDSETAYPANATVVHGTSIYISLADDNQGNEPGACLEGWWAEISGAASDRSFVAVIGDGESTTYTVAHNLGTRNLYVMLRTNEAESLFVDARVESISTTEVTVTLTSAPDVNGIVLMVAPGDRTASLWCGTIGNGTDTVYRITHNIGMYNLFRSIRMTETGEYVHAAMYAESPVTVRLEFDDPVDTDAVTVMLAPCVPAEWDGRYVYGVAEASDDWVINHGMCRVVSVQLYDSDGRQIEGEIIQDLSDRQLDTVEVLFSEPMTGFAVLHRGDSNGSCEAHLRQTQPERQRDNELRRRGAGHPPIRRVRGQSGRRRVRPVGVHRRRMARRRHLDRSGGVPETGREE